ncbi:MAG: cell division cycle protein 20-like protein [Amphiamblys sp. WSBS2006]|nr:MAG: cell division cycle protein 20-like protein [Amphiamblys sp. WSBS2006]
MFAGGTNMAPGLCRKKVKCGYDFLLYGALENDDRHITLRKREVSPYPFLKLDYPKLEDDFYSNTIDWSYPSMSSHGFVAVAAQNEICFFAPEKNKFSCGLICKKRITALKWRPRSQSTIAFGTNSGGFYLQEMFANTAGKTDKNTRRHKYEKRVVDISWRNTTDVLLSSGSSVYFLDTREPEHACQNTPLSGHTDQICGIEWNRDETLFATGGNDNLVCVWDIRHPSKPLATLAEHRAGVRAIAWSPFEKNTLMTAAGVADKSIKIWNVNGGTKSLQTVQTGSQICAMRWSQNVSSPWWSELITAHGFSDNDVRIWRVKQSTVQQPVIVQPRPASILQTRENNKRILHLSLSPRADIVAGVSAELGIFFWRI